MPKIKITCNDPYATDSSTEDDESIEEEKKPKNGGVFVEEISVSEPIIIPTISTVHLDSLVRLKSDSSFRVDESKSSTDGRNSIVLALPARKPEDTPGRKPGIFSARKTLEKLFMKCQVDASKSSSKEDESTEASPTSINVVVDIPAAKNSKSRASDYPGIRKISSGKWAVRIWNPITRNRIWVGTYSTLEEAINSYNKKKLEYAPVKSKMLMGGPGDASFRVDESKSSLDGPDCTSLALSVKEPEGTQRKDSGILSVENRPKRLSMAHKCHLDNCHLDNTSSSSHEDGSAEASPTSIDVSDSVTKKSRSPGASKHPGLRLTASGKWGVQKWDPTKRAKIWLGSYSTIEEATDVYNEKKLEYAPLKSKMLKQAASPRVDDSKSSVGRASCIVLGLAARQPEDTRRKKSGACAKHSETLGQKRYPYLRLSSSGKWGVKIRDPIKRSTVWLGTYSTVEEAKNAFYKKKREFASLRPAVFKHNQHSVSKGKHKGKHKQKNLVVEGITVYKTRLGKWRANIKNPFSRRIFWLCSHATPEEAVKSYHRKMLEFDSAYINDSVGKSSIVHDPASSGKEVANDARILALDVADKGIPACDVADVCIPAYGVASSVITNNPDSERPVSKVPETDKWRVTIRHPKLKCSFSLGLYDTPEEAEEVYNNKKLELEAVLHSDTISRPRVVDMTKQDSRPHQDTLAEVASPTAVDSNGLPVKKYTGVKLTSSGRWNSQIQGPLSKKNKVYLGTFNTAEEAADAFSTTRREFDAIISVINKRKREGDPEDNKKKRKKRKEELMYKKRIILDEASMADGEKSRLFEIVVAPHSYSRQPKFNGVCEPIQAGLNDASLSFTPFADNLAMTVVSSQGSNYSHNKQILGLSLAEHEFGAGVIDSYGQLVGEYSRLDDELWLGKPGDDEELDANGAVFGCTEELAWDPILTHLSSQNDEMEGRKNG